MSLLVAIENNSSLMQLTVDVFSKIVVPLISVYITWYIAISFNQKNGKKEKNQYLRIIKRNCSIRETFDKLFSLNNYKSRFVFTIIYGITLGILYFFISLIPIIAIFALILQNDFLSKSPLFFLIDPLNEFNRQLLLSTYLNLTLIPLFIISFLLLFLIKCRNNRIIISPKLVTRRRIGKFIQVLRCKFYSFAEISKPRLTTKMKLTERSKKYLNVFPFLIGMFIILNYLICAFLFQTLASLIEQPFSLSIDYFTSLYISTKTNLPDGWFPLAYVFLFSLTFSTLFSIGLYNSTRGFLEESKHEIIKAYSTGYPFVSIKTSSGMIEGKVEDVFNKHLIILNENGVQKLTSWKNVEIMEIKINNK